MTIQKSYQPTRLDLWAVRHPALCRAVGGALLALATLGVGLNEFEVISAAPLRFGSYALFGLGTGLLMTPGLLQRRLDKDEPA